MSFQDPLDDPRLQVPVDYANHMLWGTFLFLLALLAFSMVGLDAIEAGNWAYFICLALAVSKKVVDYFYEGETALVCAKKTGATVLLPLVLLGFRAFSLL